MSSIIERTRSGGQTHSIELILFPLFLLIGVGVMVNEFNTSGIQTTPVYTATTASTPQVIVAQNNNGCDANPDNCNITKVTAFSIIGSNNPFSFLISGNLLGFFSCLAGCPSINPTNNFIFAAGCIDTGASINNFNASTKNQAITRFHCYSATFNSDVNVPTGQYNASSSIGNNSNWIIQGTTPPTEYIYGIYKVNGSTFSNTYCDKISLCYSTTVFTCPTVSAVLISNRSSQQYCLDYLILASQTSVSFTSAFGVFGFLFGLVLVFMAFGLTVAAQFVASGATLGINSQGTRMAGVFGFGLLSWSFVIGTFGGWLSFLGLGVGTILGTVLTVVFFLGLYWRLYSLD